MGDFLTGGSATDKTTAKPMPVGADPRNYFRAVDFNDIKAHVAGWVSVKDYGAVGDGVTDDTAAIQAAIDHALYQNATRLAIILLPDGVYKTSDTVHLGYGVSAFKTVRLVGAGRRYRAQNFGGTAIVPTFSDRPALNIQGGRQVSVEDMTISGLNSDILTLGIGNGATANESSGATWVKSGLGTNADSRYAPYAGIAIDAYAGSAPNPAYPAVAYPSFLGAVSQYGKSFSSLTTFERVEVLGFVVGIAIQPSGADGNGDFTVIRDSAISYNKYNLSVGNTQSRNVQAYNTRFDNAYTAITNTVHGTQSGHLDGLFQGCSFDRTERIVDLHTAATGAVTFQGCYGELIAQIGAISNNTINNSPVRFSGCTFRFASEAEKPIPLEYLTSGSPQTVTIQDSEFFVPRVFTWDTDQLSLLNTHIRPTATIGVDVPDRLAVNAARGVFPRVPGNDRSNVYSGRLLVKTYVFADVTSSTISSKVDDLTALRIPDGAQGANVNKRNFPLSTWTPKWTPLAFDYWGNVGASINRATTNLGTVTISGIDFSFDGVAFLTGSNVALVGAGDLVFDVTTNARFRITGIVGTVITMRLLSGYDARSTPTTTITLSTNVANLIILSSRVFAMPYPTFGDTTSGSGALANLGRSDAFFGYATGSGPLVNDYLVSTTSLAAGDQFGGKKLYGNPTKLTALDVAARTATLDHNANATQTGVSLMFWMRAP